MSSITALKKVLRPPLVIAANVVLFTIVLPALFIIEPFWRIRFIHFGTERMGHLTGDLYLYLVRMETCGLPPRTSHILLGAYPCNRQLLEMWKRRLSISENPAASTFWHYCKRTIRCTRFHIDEAQTSDDHFEFSLDGPRPEFTDEEESKGRRLLAEMGLGPDDWFVSLHVSDNVAYTRLRFPEMSAQDVIDIRKDGHSLRDGNIENYFDAARHVAASGGFVLRTGAVSETELPDLGSSRIVDYTCRHRSDFGDIYLAAKARFFLGGPSGLAQASMIFGVPVALASMVPLPPHAVGPNSLYLPVLLEDRKIGNLLHYGDAYDLGLYECCHEKLVESALWFETAGLKVHQSSSKDILDLCLDMMDQTNSVDPGPEARALQHLYRDSFTTPAKSYLYAPKIGPRFALKYRHLIER